MGYGPSPLGRREIFERLHSSGPSAVKIRGIASNPDVAESGYYKSSPKTQKVAKRLDVCAFLSMIHKDGCIARQASSILAYLYTSYP
jgi:hypothetical protein